MLGNRGPLVAISIGWKLTCTARRYCGKTCPRSQGGALSGMTATAKVQVPTAVLFIVRNDCTRLTQIKVSNHLWPAKNKVSSLRRIDTLSLILCGTRDATSYRGAMVIRVWQANSNHSILPRLKHGRRRKIEKARKREKARPLFPNEPPWYTKQRQPCQQGCG